MFIDVVPNRNSRPTILIRQAYREGGKARKRTLSNITKLPPDTVEKIRKILRGADPADAPVKLEDAFEISRSLQHGNAAAVLAALRGCGVEQAIAPRRSRSRDLAVALVAQRILEPGSKLAAARLFRPETAVSTLASQLGLPENAGENRLYETMDWLLERQPRIEKALAEKHLSEGSPVLYDLTSVWSYSRTCPLVDRGYSRDGKKGLPQIEFGLLCDAEGRPVAVEAFPGNASDPSTVAAQVGKLRDRFGLKRAVFVGDRGMVTQARVREDLEPNGYDWIFALRAAGVRALADRGALQPTLFDERDMAEIECRELFGGDRLVVCRNPLLAEERTRKRKDLIAAAAQDLIEIRRAVRRDKRPLRSADAIRRRAERALDKRKMRKHFDLKIGTGSFSWKRKKQNIADEAALDGFYVIRTNVQEKRMSAAAAVETYKRLGRVERAFRTMKAPDLQVRPIRHRREPRVRAHLLICMLACHVEKHMRDALAPMLFDDERGPVRDSPVAKAERSPQAKRKAATKRTSPGEDVHDFTGLLAQLGTPAMNRIEPSGPGKPGFDVPASPTPIQAQALRLLNAKQLYLAEVKIRAESRRARVVEGSCGFCLFGAAPGPIRPLPMMDPDIVPDFCLFGSFARFSFAAARRAWNACGQSLFAPFLGFAFGARIDHILPTLPLVGGLFVNVRFGFSAVRRAWKAVDNPCSRRVRISRSGPGLTTLPTLPAVGGRSRFGAFHSATALRGFFI